MNSLLAIIYIVHSSIYMVLFTTLPLWSTQVLVFVFLCDWCAVELSYFQSRPTQTQSAQAQKMLSKSEKRLKWRQMIEYGSSLFHISLSLYYAFFNIYILLLPANSINRYIHGSTSLQWHFRLIHCVCFDFGYDFLSVLWRWPISSENRKLVEFASHKMGNWTGIWLYRGLLLRNWLYSDQL